ncbi:MAG: hypothetical protein AB7L09_02200 [Nitrospira sp.]
MSFKVGDHVKHRWAKRLHSGVVTVVHEEHHNPVPHKAGPWYEVQWDPTWDAKDPLYFHGDVLEKA